MLFRGESIAELLPDNKIHVVNMGPVWGRQDPDGPHVGPMNFAIFVGWGGICVLHYFEKSSFLESPRFLSSLQQFVVPYAQSKSKQKSIWGSF